MKTSIIQQRRYPTVAIPTSLVEYVGKSVTLRGYYVSNTQYYNIMPVDAHIEQDRVYEIGKIFNDEETKSGLIPSCLIERLDSIILGKTTSSSSNKLRSGAKSYIEIESTEENNFKVSLPQLFGYWNDGKLQIFEAFREPEEGGKIIITPVKQDYYSLKLDLFSRNTGILESDVMLKKRRYSSDAVPWGA